MNKALTPRGYIVVRYEAGKGTPTPYCQKCATRLFTNQMLHDGETKAIKGREIYTCESCQKTIKQWQP